jgi:hypothetical protein
MARLLRALFWSLLLSLLFGLVVGTLIRRRIEQPRYYIGAIEEVRSATPAPPLHVPDSRAPVLDAGHHEEQIG